jgi:methylglutaconyl-CoA hydratase
MGAESVLTEVDAAGVARVTLNKPRVHNAFDADLIQRLTGALTRLADDDAVRAVVLQGAGHNFSAGADLNWMRSAAGQSFDENVADAEALAGLLRLIHEHPRPVLARVQGAALGGGSGLVAACDMAVAAADATFSFSEVRLGLMPSVIGPYALAAIGQRHARRYFLTAERFGADEARRIGLVAEVVPADDLDGAVDRIDAEVLKGGPGAIAAAKAMIRTLAGRRIDDETVRITAEGIARLRASDEGREGIAAFLEKRPPDWVED